MSTFTNTSSAMVTFPKYSELPPELRLRIIEETLDSINPPNSYHRHKYGLKLSQYTCIDREWNRIVELRLFKDIELRHWTWDGTWPPDTVSQELVDFSAICGKRSGRLSRIKLTVESDWTLSDTKPYLHIILCAISRLFDSMKDWSIQNREQQGLIELILALGNRVDYPSLRLETPHDLSKLPQVPVIGSIHEPAPQSYHLHPCILASLCEKLPNAYHASLTLPPVTNEYISVPDVINAMDSLRAQKPGLNHLDLKFPYLPLLEWSGIRPQAFLPILQCLNASPSPWSNRLVSLEIQYTVVVQDFLRDASHTLWPNLERIKLSGLVNITIQENWGTMDEEDGKAVAGETGSSVIEALITVLPNMPKVTKIQIELLFNSYYLPEAFEAKIHLGNIARREEAGNLPHCGGNFVPNSNNGVAQVGGISLPGELAARLQDAVRCHRRQELEVCACTEDWHYYWRKPHHPCTMWNRRTESWDPVFKNDLDVFIYEMGQYWEDFVDYYNQW